MPFAIRVRVTPEDLDELLHVSNIVYIRWIQDVAVAHSASVGLTLEEYRQRGAVFVVRRHEVDYLRPALPEKTLHVRAECYRITRSIAFVKAWAWQDDEQQPVAVSQSTFMRGSPMKRAALTGDMT